MQKLQTKRAKRSIVTFFLCLGLLTLYWYHWTPQAIARFLGLKSRPRERSKPLSVSLGGGERSGAPGISGVGGGGSLVVAPAGGGSGGGMGGSEASLVWVLLGDTHYQPYLLESIRQARVFNPNELFFLVVEPRFWPSNHSWIKPLKKLGVRQGGGAGWGGPPFLARPFLFVSSSRTLTRTPHSFAVAGHPCELHGA